MPKKSYRQAINEALRGEMRRDANVIIIGEDVAGGEGATGETGNVGGVFGVTGGLYKEFGPGRVLDTPISESAIIGAASGAAVTGMRPVAEIMFVDFVGVCFDQIYNQAAKFRYMFGGHAKTPMVIRTMIGAGFRAGAQHSQTLHPLFTMVPGLKVVMPANAYDAKGLLISAIRDDDPVIFMESKVLYDTEMEVPDEAYRIPFGEANVAREGKDMTFVAFGPMVRRAIEVAETHDLMLYAKDIRETTLGQSARKRHLSTFELRLSTAGSVVTSTRLHSLVSLTGSLSGAGSRTTAKTLPIPV